MRLYWEMARLGFKRYATYRGATFAGVFTNTVFGFMLAFVSLSLFTSRARVAGYDATDAITYVWVTQGLLSTVHVGGWSEIAQRVRTGDVATDFHRPFDFQGYWLAQDLGRAAYHAIFRGIPPAAVAALVFPLRLPSRPATWPLFGLSVLLAVCISFSIRFLANMAAFWITDFRGVVSITAATVPFLAGMYGIPLAFLPPAAFAVLRALPFAGMGQAPLTVFLQKPDVAATLALQAAWALALLAAGRLVLRAAHRRLVVQGG
ncbi:MAG TPA: ABC-2 family transporter protein [Candidatus Dormibacteraeota bacterium]|nr:ABC-2 family transporter protein [Candidatus Dormibacteraeota bacterium]